MRTEKSEIRSQESGVGNRRRAAFVFRAIVLLFTVFCLLSPSYVRATPTQEEVFKSIQTNVGQSADSGKVLGVLAVAGGIVIILVLFSRRQKRGVMPKAMNNQSKLLRELSKTAGLKTADVRQLRALA